MKCKYAFTNFQRNALKLSIKQSSQTGSDALQDPAGCSFSCKFFRKRRNSLYIKENSKFFGIHLSMTTFAIYIAINTIQLFLGGNYTRAR
jgi:hypothetical protein